MVIAVSQYALEKQRRRESGEEKDPEPMTLRKVIRLEIVLFVWLWSSMAVALWCMYSNCLHHWS